MTLLSVSTMWCASVYVLKISQGSNWYAPVSAASRKHLKGLEQKRILDSLDMSTWYSQDRIATRDGKIMRYICLAWFATAREHSSFSSCLSLRKFHIYYNIHSSYFASTFKDDVQRCSRTSLLAHCCLSCYFFNSGHKGNSSKIRILYCSSYCSKTLEEFYLGYVTQPVYKILFLQILFIPGCWMNQPQSIAFPGFNLLSSAMFRIRTTGRVHSLTFLFRSPSNPFSLIFMKSCVSITARVVGSRANSVRETVASCSKTHFSPNQVPAGYSRDHSPW